MIAPSNLWSDFERLYWTDQVLAVMIASISFLLLAALLFTILVVVLRVKNLRTRSDWERLEAQWGELLLDILAGDHGESVLRARVAAGDEGAFVDYLYRFARQVRGSERESLSQLGLPYLSAMVAQLGSRSPERRARAVLVISGLGAAEYEDELVAALDDESPLVAMVAARALANEQHVHHAGSILQRIGRFEEWNPRHLAAMFAAIGPAAAPSLRATLADPAAGDRARIVAAEALLLLRDLSAIDAVRTILDGWATPEVLVAGLRLLEAIGSDREADIVRRLVKSSHPAVRSAAILALGALGDNRDVPLAQRAIADDSPWVSLNAAAALAELGQHALLEDLAASDGRGAHAAREILTRSRA